jgi:hypothetical protein
MKTFPALVVISSIYRLLAILLAIATVLAALGAGYFMGAITVLISGGITALVLYGIGEGILLLIDMHRQQCASTEALIRLYQNSQPKPQIKPLKHARRSG